MWQQVICSRYAAISLIWLFQMTIVFKRQLAELKILSYIFLAVIISFICLMFTELMTDKVAVADTLNMDELTRTKIDYHLITAISILVFAFQI